LTCSRTAGRLAGRLVPTRDQVPRAVSGEAFAELPPPKDLPQILAHQGLDPTAVNSERRVDRGGMSTKTGAPWRCIPLLPFLCYSDFVRAVDRVGPIGKGIVSWDRLPRIPDVLKSVGDTFSGVRKDLPQILALEPRRADEVRWCKTATVRLRCGHEQCGSGASDAGKITRSAWLARQPAVPGGIQIPPGRALGRGGLSLEP